MDFVEQICNIYIYIYCILPSVAGEPASAITDLKLMHQIMKAEFFFLFPYSMLHVMRTQGSPLDFMLKSMSLVYSSVCIYLIYE